MKTRLNFFRAGPYIMDGVIPDTERVPIPGWHAAFGERSDAQDALLNQTDIVCGSLLEVRDLMVTIQGFF